MTKEELRSMIDGSKPCRICGGGRYMISNEPKEDRYHQKRCPGDYDETLHALVEYALASWSRFERDEAGSGQPDDEREKLSKGPEVKKVYLPLFHRANFNKDAATSLMLLSSFFLDVARALELGLSSLPVAGFKVTMPKEVVDATREGIPSFFWKDDVTVTVTIPGHGLEEKRS